jgi:hypothetical protein
MGIWLMPYPEAYMPLGLRAWKDDDLAAVLETLRALMLDGTIRMVPQIYTGSGHRGCATAAGRPSSAWSMRSSRLGHFLIRPR